MRVIVSGATGFLGRHLTERLVREGHEVHVLARHQSRLTCLSRVLSSIHVHMLSEDGANLDKIVAQAKAEIAFHLAAYFVAEHTQQDITPMMQANVVFPLRLVDSFARNGGRLLLNCSSAWQHHKDEEYNPVSLYAASKQAFLAILKYYVEAAELSVVDMTIPDTYGPRDDRPKLFSALYRAASGERPLAMSSGEQLLDILFVDDAIDALVLAGIWSDQRVGTLTRYSLHARRTVQLRELVASFSRVTGVSPTIAWGARAPRKREVMLPWLGGKALPGWTPNTELEEGIRRMHAHYVRNS